MVKIIILTMLLLNVSINTASTQDDPFINLNVKVESILSVEGEEIGVAIFENRMGYPTHLEHAYETAWIELEGNEESVEFLFDSLIPGEYAISVVHDNNGNRQIDRSRLGFPKEGVGFSNDQRVVLSAPKFKKAKFTLAAGENKKIIIQIEYRNKN